MKCGIRMTQNWFLLIVILSVVQADIGNVHTVLKYQLQKCTIIRHSVRSAFSLLLQCIESSVYRCLLFHEPLGRVHVTQMKGACGVINSGQKLEPNWWNIDVHSKYSLSINFLHFHLPCFSYCEGIYVSLDLPGVLHHPRHKRYCGYQMPWNMSQSTPSGIVTLYREHELVKDYYFVLTFEAFDINSPLVGVVFERFRNMVLRNPRTSFSVGITRNTAFSLFDTEGHIYLTAHLISQIVVKHPTAPKSIHGMKYNYLYNWSDFIHPTSSTPLISMFNIRVYDDPGILSLLIVPKCNTTIEYCTYYLSSYKGFFKYRLPVSSSFKTGYGWNMSRGRPRDHSKEQGIIWSSNWVLVRWIVFLKETLYIFAAGQASAGASHSTTL